MKRLTTAKMLAVGLAVSGVVLTGGRVHADAVADTAALNTNTAVTVTADCMDMNTAQAFWKVNNPTNAEVNVMWANQNGTTNGIYNALPGDGQLVTPYDGSNPTENYVFAQTGQDDETVAVPTVACNPPVVTTPCVDGTVAGSLQFNWTGKGLATIRTANGGLLCNDVTLYFSSYTLPATYDGSGVFDDSALPQQLYDSNSIVLLAGTAGNITVSVGVPEDACTNYQLDLYYAPEITTVPNAGHGSQLIYGEIYPATSTNCGCPQQPEQPPVTPGRGGGEETPPVVTPTPTPTPAPIETAAVVVPAPVAAPAQLVNTGFPVWESTAAGFALIGLAVSAAQGDRLFRAVRRAAVRFGSHTDNA